jgi:thiamine biosynthesis lipoprotein
MKESRRCRPLLGTFIEIRVSADDEREAERAIARAFDAAAEVHRLMSFHEAESELSLLNREARRCDVAVHPWTFEVLAFAQLLARTTRGAFDVTIGAQLVEWEYLPWTESGPTGGDYRSVELLDRCRVRFHDNLLIDLGGIAKGFAVDKAVDALKAEGIVSGLVNAGGDMRAFGSADQSVFVRSPDESALLTYLLTLKNAALATSAPTPSAKSVGGRRVSALVSGRAREPLLQPVSVSVKAPTCMAADALTKVVLAADCESAPILRSMGALAYKFENGAISLLSDEY